jgi:hypothetical protein
LRAISGNTALLSLNNFFGLLFGSPPDSYIAFIIVRYLTILSTAEFLWHLIQGLRGPHHNYIVPLQ